MDRAEIAFLARKASKKYIRERSNFLASLFAKLMDLFRHWNVNEAPVTKLWNKKAHKIGKV